jgi:hypothetical protein
MEELHNHALTEMEPSPSIQITKPLLQDPLLSLRKKHLKNQLSTKEITLPVRTEETSR